MTIELKMLFCSVVLGFVQIFLQGGSMALVRGFRWNMSTREKSVSPLTGWPARADRALQNFKESFPLFVAAVLMAHVLGVHSFWTEWGACFYFFGRLAYVPIYVAGGTTLRSLAWGVSLVGIAMILIGVLV